MTIFRAGGGRLFLLVRCNVKHFRGSSYVAINHSNKGAREHCTKENLNLFPAKFEVRTMLSYGPGFFRPARRTGHKS